MTIIHLRDYYTSRLKYQVYYLSRAHAAQGHMVHIVTADRNRPFQDYNNTVLSMYGPREIGVGKFEEENGIMVHRLPVKFEIGTRPKLSGIRRLIKSISPDVVICHGIVNFSSLDVLRIKNPSFKIIFDDHMTTNQIRNGLLGRTFYSIFRTFLSKRYYAKASAIVGISNDCINVINKVFGLAGDKVKMIPLAASVENFDIDRQAGIKFKEQNNIDQDSTVIVNTGKITTYKKVHLIIDVCQKIAYPNLTLLFVGNIESSYKDFFLQKMKESVHTIVYLPAVDNKHLSDVYNASDIAVWADHLTISTIEASACGIPIICSNVMSERYANKNGIGIDPGNEEQLEEAIRKVLFDESLRQLMGANGAELVKKKLNWNSIAMEFLEQ